MAPAAGNSAAKAAATRSAVTKKAQNVQQRQGRHAGVAAGQREEMLFRRFIEECNPT